LEGSLAGNDVQRRYLWKSFPDQAERDSGIARKVFGFARNPQIILILAACSPAKHFGTEVRRNPIGLEMLLSLLRMSLPLEWMKCRDLRP
jgi:hypothetical protein